MKSLNTKLVLSALGIVAVLAGPAFAKEQRQAIQASGPAVYNAVPGYDTAANVIPGYDRSGAVVAIPNPDQYGFQPQR